MKCPECGAMMTQRSNGDHVCRCGTEIDRNQKRLGVEA